MVWAPESHFDRHLPLTLLTGFLGSGKTTLLNRLLRDPRLADTAVAVNEFGAIPLDHVLIDAPADDVVVLANGCLCCFASDDLHAALARILRRSEAGDLPPFRRLVIETSGMADPEYVLQSVLDNPLGARFLWLDAIVTTVDALHGAGQLERHAEARKQVWLADRLVLTKTDLADPADVAMLRKKLAALNGRAEHLIAPPDAPIDPLRIVSPAFLDDDPRRSLLGDWVRRDGHLSSGRPHDHSHPETRAVAATLTADTPLDWRRFHLWLGREQRRFGDALLRVKGIVNIAGSAEPVVIHGVQTTLHVPTSLRQWPDADRRTRLVFIFAGDHAEAVEASWRDFLAEAALV